MDNANLADIYFIRHGETDWNKQGRYQGQSDIELNQTGIEQGKTNGVILQKIFHQKNLKPSDFNWFSSPLSRTRKTTEIIREQLSEPLPEVTIDERLIELSFGVCEGFRHDDLDDELAAALPKRGERGSEFWGLKVSGSESYVEASKRINSFLSEINKPTIVVSHGGIARVFRHIIANTPQVEVVNWIAPQNAVFYFSDSSMKTYKSGNK